MTAQELLQTYEKALAMQQWENVEPLMHPDVCVTFNNGTYKGIEEVEGAFRRTFALIQDETYAISNVHWIREDDALAVCLYHFHWSGIINGQMASGGGRGTSVLVNENGRWQILTEHLGPEAK